jgi:hypothetical protein
MREFIIAHNAVHACDYALKQGWRQFDRFDRHRYWRPNFTAAGQHTVPQLVEYVANPDAISALDPAEATIHLGRFPQGIPAAWAKALARFKIIGDITGVRVGGFLPMDTAPRDRPIMIYDADARAWESAQWWPQTDGYWNAMSAGHLTDIEIEFPACWHEPLPEPPEILIQAALKRKCGTTRREEIAASPPAFSAPSVGDG